MNVDSFKKLVDDAKSWINQEFADQKAVLVADYEPPSKKIVQKPVVKKPEALTQEASLAPFFQEHELSDIEVFLITNTQNNEEKALVERLTHAIDTRIAKAKLIYCDEIEKNSLWQKFFACSKKLRHVLVSEVEFYQFTGLLKHYQRAPKRSIFNVPLFLLADLKNYNLDVELKKNLWTSLLSELK
ncbi:MAG: hypothetical protein S4CHLAM6_01960 [Chlamydiae bacterium]|nr:hypothetical protein [Chlamydiota bacterium]